MAEAKKSWIQIHAPKKWKEKVVGETLGTPDSVKGRTLIVYYSDLSGDVTKYYIKLKLQITDVKGEHAYTSIKEYEIMRPHLARMIRRRISKVDVIKDLQTKDGKKVRMKLVAITPSKANTSQKTLLRKRIEEELEKIVPAYELEELIVEVANGKIQNELAKKVKSIYPIRYMEVRKIEVS